MYRPYANSRFARKNTLVNEDEVQSFASTTANGNLAGAATPRLSTKALAAILAKNHDKIDAARASMDSSIKRKKKKVTRLMNALAEAQQAVEDEQPAGEALLLGYRQLLLLQIRTII
jgi:hypothetical protein